MTCYMRHMRPLFETLGLEYDEPNRRAVDSGIRDALAVPPEAHCPEVWAAIKSLPDAERAALPTRVAEYLAAR